MRENGQRNRNVIHTSKLCFITLTPEIISGPMVKAANAFSLVSQSFCAETSGNLPLKPRKIVFLSVPTQRCDSSVLWHKNRHTGSSYDLRMVVCLPADIDHFKPVAGSGAINTMTTSLNHGYRGAVRLLLGFRPDWRFILCWLAWVGDAIFPLSDCV